jgi:hypothetical protein
MKTKNVGILLLCMLAGLTIGDCAGEFLSKIRYLQFFSFGQTFGLQNPVTIYLGIITLMIQFEITFTLAGILGMLSGIWIYKKIAL